MPYNEVMHKWKAGTLHSGGPKGPKVTSQKQAVAIMMSEKRKADEGKKEYQPKPRGYHKGGSVEHSTEDAFKANLVETLANPTGKTKFAKGGAVAKSNPPAGHGWRRWGHGK